MGDVTGSFHSETTPGMGHHPRGGQLGTGRDGPGGMCSEMVGCDPVVVRAEVAGGVGHLWTVSSVALR